MALRTFELYYWEHYTPTSINYFQDWNYQWNAMWCIFVSMTTVGYGDFYPKTQFGRFICILACLVGVYFVSMLMVFLTSKSVFNQHENKAFKLIMRLHHREEVKDLRSHMIYCFLKILQMKKRQEDNGDRALDISEEEKRKLTHHKRRIIGFIGEIKDKIRLIKSFEFIPTKEQLMDISERFNMIIRDIKVEFQSLKCK